MMKYFNAGSTVASSKFFTTKRKQSRLIYFLTYFLNLEIASTQVLARIMSYCFILYFPSSEEEIVQHYNKYFAGNKHFLYLDSF